MRKLLSVFACALLINTYCLALIDIGIFAPGSFGTNPTGAKMEIAISPQSLYPFPPAAAEFNLIIFAPSSDLSGSEVFTVLEDNINNGGVSWDNGQTFAHNGNTYFVFVYSGTGIDLSSYGSGAYSLAMTLGVTGGSGTTTFSIADENSDIHNDFSIRSALNVLSINELAGIASPVSLSNVSLPVELVSFTAQKRMPNEVQLQWKVATESKMDKYVIERTISPSSDFSAIGEVTANNNELSNYEFIDKEILRSASYYYRLRMIELDGSYTFGPIRELSFSFESALSIYPNPAKDYVEIHFSSSINQSSFNIYNAQKDLVHSGETQRGAMLYIEVSNWPPGTYYVTFDQNNSQESHSFVLVK